MRIFILTIMLGLTVSMAQAIDVNNQSYIKKILGSYADSKLVSKSIYRGTNVDQIVLDVLAEELLERYEGASPQMVDSLSWMAKALGSTQNYRYFNVLSEVAEKTTHDKLRKYAESALLEIEKSDGEQYVKGQVDLKVLRKTHGVKFVNYIEQEARFKKQYYIDMLVRSGNSIRVVAKKIYKDAEKNQEVLDVAAEVLLERYAHANRNIVDALSWLVKALGSSKNPRYYYVLKEVRDLSTHKKLRKYTDSAFEQIDQPNANTSLYIKGSVDLLVLQEAVRVKALKNQTRKMQLIYRGMSRQEVDSILGSPSSIIRSKKMKFTPFGVGIQGVTTALYKGQGSLEFTYSSNTIRVSRIIFDQYEWGYP